VGTTTPKFGLPYPVLGDSPNGPAAIGALALAVDATGVLGGKRRTTASSAINTIESIVVDTQTLSLLANSVYLIEYNLTFAASVAASDGLMRVRLTSVSGTVLGSAIALGVYATQNNSGYMAILYKTTAAELDYFCGTLIRQVGTGNLTAQVPTSLVVSYVGPNTLIGDF